MSRDHVKIKNKATMAEFMRYNDFENDEFALFEGKCTEFTLKMIGQFHLGFLPPFKIYETIS